MASKAAIIANVRLLLELPTGSSWNDTDLGSIVNLAHKSVFNELARNGFFFFYDEETVTLTDALEYTLTNDYPRILNIYKDKITYELIDPQEWPCERPYVCWYDRKNSKLKFFKAPETQGDFTVRGCKAWTEDDFDYIPEEWEHIIVLKSLILTGKSEKERIEDWKEEYQSELMSLIDNASLRTDPRYVRQVNHED